MAYKNLDGHIKLKYKKLQISKNLGYIKSVPDTYK